MILVFLSDSSEFLVILCGAPLCAFFLLPSFDDRGARASDDCGCAYTLRHGFVWWDLLHKCAKNCNSNVRSMQISGSSPSQSPCAHYFFLESFSKSPCASLAPPKPVTRNFPKV